MPRVSVIIPTHNRPVLLAEALTSLLAQTFTDWEALIVDDASTTPVTIDEGDKRIRVLRHSSSQGGAAAKNAGIKDASAEILAFLDDDDLYAPQYLERALGILDRNPNLDVVFMGVSWFGTAGSWGQRNYDEAMAKTLALAQGKALEEGVITFGDRLLDALLKSVPMAFQRPVVRKRALERIGPYRPDCLLWDCDWAISAALNASTAFLPDGLYLQRAEGQGYSSRGNRRLEHLASSIEIKDRFLQNAHHGLYPQRLIPQFRKAAAMAWFDLAWHHYQQNNRRRAFGALWASELRQFSLPHLKLLVRLMLPNKSL
ncbi:family 2 glycosyl transferase [Sulfuricella denitrificans skB26]|uniref:Family 2 glycosyl transferase n=1 Tax=Sulfuricella denitrificans (strain DSM 22764 / NBRC 105220 / skB26) TaxID=1163617 RepID=S6ADW4_SULDS|nr:glycosyltransferase [Sulfuricella denitrificans]BAN36773.1 family 2 glycosyl transferase [Sulfuricella denitrificans skB26]